jgi:nicotinamidase-related amidase
VLASLPQACVPAAQRLLQACRAAGLQVLHTLEAHKPDLSDLHPSKLARGRLPEGLRIGDTPAAGACTALVAGSGDLAMSSTGTGHPSHWGLPRAQDPLRQRPGGGPSRQS